MTYNFVYNAFINDYYSIYIFELSLLTVHSTSIQGQHPKIWIFKKNIFLINLFHLFIQWLLYVSHNFDDQWEFICTIDVDYI